MQDDAGLAVLSQRSDDLLQPPYRLLNLARGGVQAGTIYLEPMVLHSEQDHVVPGRIDLGGGI